MSKILGERLKELRLSKQLSFMELSKEVGISHTSLCRWENDKADISGQYLVILADYYNVTTDYLLGRTNE